MRGRRSLGAGAASLAVGLALGGRAEAGETDCPAPGPTGLADGCYRDRDGVLRNPATVQAEREAEADPDHLRAMVEEALFLTAGTIWYWADQERNLADWDYPSWEQRFTFEVWRYDNNEFPINFIAHTLNGASFYAFPRANDHDVYVSTFYSFTTSWMWEFLLEFREKLSINDMLVTPLAGLPVGEFAQKLWRYVNGLPPEATTWQEVAAVGLGLPIWLHRLLDGGPAAAGPYDDLGLSTAIGHRFELGYRFALHDFGEEVVTHGFRLGGRLSSLPGEGEPGHFGLFFHDADVVSLRLAAGTGPRAREVELVTESHILGYYAQALDRRGDGHSVLVGLPVAYRYRFQDFEGYNDRLGILGLPGLGVDFLVRSGDVAFGSHVRLHGEFAGVSSAAYGTWAAERVGPGDRVKSILSRHGYYYGWGGSTRFGSELRLGPLDLGAGALLGAYDSHEGLDRTQEELTLDPDSTDELLEIEATVGLTIPATPVRVALDSVSTERRSHVEGRSVRRGKQSWVVFLGLSF